MELTKELEEKLKEDAKLTKELRENFEQFKTGTITKADYDTKEKKITDAIGAVGKRIDELETKITRPPAVGSDIKDDIPGKKEYKAAFFNFVRNGKLEMDEKVVKYIAERKALVSDTTGQILIPEELEAEIYRALGKINVIRKYATIRPIARDRIRRRSLTEVQMGWGKLELGKEPVETTVVPSEDWQYVEDLEGLAKIGKDELADSDVAIEATVIDSFSRAQAETEETAFVKGTAHTNQQPDGILNGSTVTRVLTASADAIVCDDVLNLIYALPAQYRANGILFFPSTTHLALRKLKSAVEGIYLWQPAVQAGQPATFAGYPVEACEDIPAIASSLSCDIGIFGDLKSGYRILDRQGMTVQRLVELFTTAGLIGILVSKRVGGGVIRPDAIRILREHA